MSLSHLDTGTGEHALPVEFTVVRHGQTGENVRGILQGWLNTPLDERGVRQSRAVAESLRDETFDRLVSSDLQRALESAAPLGERLGLPVEKMSALREWHLGDLEGRPVRELQREYPEIMGAFLRDTAEEIDVPGGETHEAFFARIAACLDALARENPGRRLLLVTHGGVLRAIYRHVVGFVSSGRLIPQTGNACICRFCYRNGEWQLTCWNDLSHLKSVGYRESLTF